MLQELNVAEPRPSAQEVSSRIAIDEGSAVAVAEEPDEPEELELPQPAARGAAVDLDAIRMAIVTALDEKSHHTAAALLTEAKWSDRGDVIEAEIGVKKIMLGLVMIPEADKIARAALRSVLDGVGVTRKFQVVAGEAGAATGAPRPPSQGSIQAQALENPLVKQAQELFRAEVRSVLDLRDKK
jgi:DNA polymerase-3 subunit gamma/tau